MMTRMRAALAICAALCVFLTGTAAAQGASGALNGQVVHQSGGAMPGVTVTATNPATGDARVVVTSEAGTYQLSALPLGR